MKTIHICCRKPGDIIKNYLTRDMHLIIYKYLPIIFDGISLKGTDICLSEQMDYKMVLTGGILTSDLLVY